MSICHRWDSTGILNLIAFSSHSSLFPISSLLCAKEALCHCYRDILMLWTQADFTRQVLDDSTTLGNNIWGNYEERYLSEHGNMG